MVLLRLTEGTRGHSEGTRGPGARLYHTVSDEEMWDYTQVPPFKGALLPTGLLPLEESG